MNPRVPSSQSSIAVLLHQLQVMVAKQTRSITGRSFTPFHYDYLLERSEYSLMHSRPSQRLGSLFAFNLLCLCPSNQALRLSPRRGMSKKVKMKLSGPASWHLAEQKQAALSMSQAGKHWGRREREWRTRNSAILQHEESCCPLCLITHNASGDVTQFCIHQVTLEGDFLVV